MDINKWVDEIEAVYDADNPKIACILAELDCIKGTIKRFHGGDCHIEYWLVNKQLVSGLKPLNI